MFNTSASKTPRRCPEDATVAAQRRVRFSPRTAAWLVVIGWLLIVVSSSALANTYVVNTTADAMIADGSVSLREAITAANADAASFDASAGDTDGDTIVFDSTVFGTPGATITLVLGELPVTDDVVIDGLTGSGGGATMVTIDGASSSRIFYIDTATGPGGLQLALLQGLILQNGNAIGTEAAVDGLGGAIHVAAGALLQTEGSRIQNNTATDGGGIYNAGGSLLRGTVVDSNEATGAGSTNGGGGIYQAVGGDMTIQQLSGVGSRITSNQATGASGSGGGLFIAGGSLLVSSNTTINGNAANRAGGGIEIIDGTANIMGGNARLEVNNVNGVAGTANPGNGGGIHVSGAATVTTNNAIISGNQAANEGGGIWNSAAGTLNVISTQVNNNLAEGSGGGGIFNNGGRLDLDAGAGPTTVNGNSTSAANGAGDGGAILSRGGNVTVDGTGNQVSNLSSNTAAGSGGGIAMTGGAVSTLTITNAIVQSNLGDVVGGGLYLVNVTTSLIDAEIINNDVNGSGGGVFQESGTFAMDIDSLIGGNDALSGPGGGFYLNGITTTTVFGSVSNNSSASSGGGILLAGRDLTIDGGTISGNSAQGVGGGIAIVGDLRAANVISGSLIDGNMAGGHGGGVSIDDTGGTLTAANSTISNNEADANDDNDGNGGGINNLGAGTVTITNSTISGNTAVDGGGIYNDDQGGSSGSLTLTTVGVTSNTAKRSGGGLFQSVGTGSVTLSEVLCDGNAANGTASTNGGGGIYNEGFALILDATVSVANNTATAGSGSGGGIFNNTGGTLTLTGSTVSGNSANRAGGGIEDRSGAGLGVSLSNVFLINNAALDGPGNGGGLHVTGAGDVSVVGSAVNDNTAASEGGGLWNGGGTMTIAGVAIGGNVASGAAADNGGGGIFNAGGVVNVQASTLISDNVADGTAGSGGGIFNDAGGTLTLDGVTLVNNTANRAGGGIEDNSGAGLGVSLNDVALQSNAALSNPGSGGGLHVTGAGDVSINASAIVTNSAAASGGGLWNGSGTMTVIDSVIVANVASGASAAQGGGGIFNNGGHVSLSGTTGVDVNSATGLDANGGGVFVNGGSLQANAVTINNNSSQGVYATSGAMVSLASVTSGINAGNGLETNGAASVYLDGGNFSGIQIRNTGSFATDGNITFDGTLDIATTANIDVLTGGWFGIPDVILTPGTTATFAAGTSSGYTGTTLLSSGTTIVDGTLAAGGLVSVNSPAVLGGSGLIQRGIEVSGTLAPGPAAAAPGDTGVLSINDNLSFLTGANFDTGINALGAGSGYDQVAVSGDVTIGPNVNLIGGATTTFAAGDSFALIDNQSVGAIAGTFANAVPPSPPANIFFGAEYFDFDYLGGDGNDFVLGTTPSTDLVITKDDGVTEAIPGSSVIYTITASNAGSVDVTGNTVSDSFPAACTAVNWTCVGAGGGSCTSGDTGNINDTVDLPASASVTYTATCNIDSAATGTLENTASVAIGAGVLDTDPLNDSATDSDSLTPTADLAISKTDGVEIAAPEDILIYTITVGNSGPSDAIGITVSDLLPMDLGNASWSCEAVPPGPVTACGNASGPGDIDELVDIAPGEQVVFELMATVDAGLFESQIENTATVMVPLALVDPEPGNNSDSDITSSAGVFADGFEDVVMPLNVTRRSALLRAADLAARLPREFGLKPVLVAKGSDSLLPEQVLVHARRNDDQIEVRMDHWMSGQWTPGRWQPLNDAGIQLAW